MLMLKMLVLKMVKKYINIYKYKLSLLCRDDTKQAKSLIFIVVPHVEQFPKEQKKRCWMLLEPIIVAIASCARKSFLKLCLKVLMLLHFFVDSDDWFHFVQESEF